MEPTQAMFIAGAVNLTIQAIAMWGNYKLIDWRMQQVEDKVKVHDEFHERLVRLETISEEGLCKHR